MVMNIRSKNTVEKLHERDPDITAYPFVKNIDQEPAVLFGSDRSVSHLGAFLVTGFVIPLDDRDELEITHSQFVAEKAVHFEGMLAVDCIDRTQDIEFHIVLLHQSCRSDHLIEHGFSGFIMAVGIVQVAGSV